MCGDTLTRHIDFNRPRLGGNNELLEQNGQKHRVHGRKLGPLFRQSFTLLREFRRRSSNECHTWLFSRLCRERDDLAPSTRGSPAPLGSLLRGLRQPLRRAVKWMLCGPGEANCGEERNRLACNTEASRLVGV